MLDGVEYGRKDVGRWLAKLEGILEVFWGEAAEIIKAGALIDGLVCGNDLPEGITETMTDGEFGEVAGKLIGDGEVVVGDVKFGEKGSGSADCACGTYVIAAKKGVFDDFDFESEGKKRSHGGPARSGRGNPGNGGIVTTDTERDVGKVVASIENSDVVVCVVVVRAGLAGEAHAGEWAVLAFNFSFEFEMKILELGWDAGKLHFEEFKDNSLAALRLVESGIVVADPQFIRWKILARPFSEFVGSVGSIDENMGMGFALADEALVFLNGAKEEDDSVVSESESLTGFPAGEKGVLVDFMLCLCEDADNGVAPTGVRSKEVGRDDGFCF